MKHLKPKSKEEILNYLENTPNVQKEFDVIKAIQAERIDVIKLILRHGINFNNEEDITHVAVRSDDPSIVSLILYYNQPSIERAKTMKQYMSFIPFFYKHKEKIKKVIDDYLYYKKREKVDYKNSI